MKLPYIPIDLPIWAWGLIAASIVILIYLLFFRSGGINEYDVQKLVSSKLDILQEYQKKLEEYGSKLSTLEEELKNQQSLIDTAQLDKLGELHTKLEEYSQRLSALETKEIPIIDSDILQKLDDLHSKLDEYQQRLTSLETEGTQTVPFAAPVQGDFVPEAAPLETPAPLKAAPLEAAPLEAAPLEALMPTLPAVDKDMYNCLTGRDPITEGVHVWDRLTKTCIVLDKGVDSREALAKACNDKMNTLNIMDYCDNQELTLLKPVDYICNDPVAANTVYDKSLFTKMFTDKVDDISPEDYWKNQGKIKTLEDVWGKVYECDDKLKDQKIDKYRCFDIAPKYKKNVCAKYQKQRKATPQCIKWKHAKGNVVCEQCQPGLSGDMCEIKN